MKLVAKKTVFAKIAHIHIQEKTIAKNVNADYRATESVHIKNETKFTVNHALYCFIDINT